MLAPDGMRAHIATHDGPGVMVVATSDALRAVNRSDLPRSRSSCRCGGAPQRRGRTPRAAGPASSSDRYRPAARGSAARAAPRGPRSGRSQHAHPRRWRPRTRRPRRPLRADVEARNDRKRWSRWIAPAASRPCRSVVTVRSRASPVPIRGASPATSACPTARPARRPPRTGDHFRRRHRPPPACRARAARRARRGG